MENVNNKGTAAETERESMIFQLDNSMSYRIVQEITGNQNNDGGTSC